MKIMNINFLVTYILIAMFYILFYLIIISFRGIESIELKNSKLNLNFISDFSSICETHSLIRF